MSVWYLIPSKRPPEEAEPVLRQWQERGYEVLVQRDGGDASLFVPSITRPYQGYAEAVNFLVKYVLVQDEECEWIVTGGDDMLPDPHKSAEEIAEECNDYFRSSALCSSLRGEVPDYSGGELDALATFGVMQPVGDRWLVNGPGTQPGSECVAGSPWMGRSWCERINQGRGPLWPEYFHCGEDEELQAVAIKYGVFWQRPDLTHEHRHWGRPKEGERLAPASRMPAFLQRANSREEWQKMKALLAERKANNWPGTEPIA